MLHKLSSLLENILKKWKNYIQKAYFDERNDQFQTNLKSFAKKHFKQ